LQETEIPPLVEEDEKTPPFWTHWLSRKPQIDSTLEAESLPEVESQITEAEQVEVNEEAKPNLVERIKSMFRFNSKKEESESNQEVEDEVEKEIVEEEKTPTEPADMIFAEIGK